MVIYTKLLKSSIKMLFDTSSNNTRNIDNNNGIIKLKFKEFNTENSESKNKLISIKNKLKETNNLLLKTFENSDRLFTMRKKTNLHNSHFKANSTNSNNSTNSRQSKSSNSSIYKEELRDHVVIEDEKKIKKRIMIKKEIKHINPYNPNV